MQCRKCNTDKPADAFAHNRRVCKVCRRKTPEQRRAEYLRNKDKILANSMDWYERNKERKAETQKAWQAANPEKVDAAVKRYRATGAMNANTRAYNLAKKHRTPAWADLQKIQAVYVVAKAYGLEVDHIHPLQGETVSGLHTLENLQLLTREQNAAKSNSFEEAA